MVPFSITEENDTQESGYEEELNLRSTICKNSVGAQKCLMLKTRVHICIHVEFWKHSFRGFGASARRRSSAELKVASGLFPTRGYLTRGNSVDSWLIYFESSLAAYPYRAFRSSNTCLLTEVFRTWISS